MSSTTIQRSKRLTIGACGLAAIETLMAENQSMAERLAYRYSCGPHLDPDLRQVADLGLFLAARRYDPLMGPFRPYAAATIVGELKKHLRSHGWTVRVPRRLQETSIAVSAAGALLEQRLQRSPNPQDIAEETGLSVDAVLAALQVRNAQFAAEHPDTDPSDNHSYSSIDLTVDLSWAAEKLSKQDRELVELRFIEELTQRQIAERLHISQSQVHRRLLAVLNELRCVLSTSGEAD